MFAPPFLFAFLGFFLWAGSRHTTRENDGTHEIFTQKGKRPFWLVCQTNFWLLAKHFFTQSSCLPSTMSHNMAKNGEENNNSNTTAMMHRLRFLSFSSCVYTFSCSVASSVNAVLAGIRRQQAGDVHTSTQDDYCLLDTLLTNVQKT